MTRIISAQPTGDSRQVAGSGWLERLAALPDQAWFAYSTIFLLQLHGMWNIWRNADLTSGDTSQYFITGWHWYAHHTVGLAMSPLYTMFYGSLLWVTTDVYSVTILHRLVIVLAGTLMVLGVMRGILPKWIAWLVAAWWAILPVNFNAFYEVHQFALLPILVAWLVAVRGRPGPWTRGIVLAILVVDTVLVRNEMMVATGCFALFCLVDELKRRKREPAGWKPFATGLAYVVPLALLIPIFGWFFVHSDSSLAVLRAQLRNKHTLNMAQVYAFGYQQRHPEWKLSPWTECYELCQRDFGDPQPSLGTMILRNPRAVATHFLWNFSMLPSGIQLLLFDKTSGSVDPDYTPVQLHSKVAWWYSVALGVGVAIAALIWWWEREKWREWFGANQIAWEAMLSVATIMPFIVATQRPRPEYLYGFSLFLMAGVGAGLWIIASHFPRWRWMGLLMTVAMIAGTAAVRTKYNEHPERIVFHPLYDRLRPFQFAIERADTVFLKGEFANELWGYLGHGLGKPLVYGQVFSDWASGETLEQVLERHGVNLFYLDQREFSELEQRQPDLLKRFFAEAGAHGWRMIGDQQLDDGWWMLLRRTPETYAGVFTVPEFMQFSGWHDGVNVQPVEGPYPKANLPVVRWALYPQASIAVTTKQSGRYRLIASGIASLKNQTVNVGVDGKQLLLHQFQKPGVFESFDADMTLSEGEHRVTMEFHNFIQGDPDSPRLGVLLRELSIAPVPAKSLPPATAPR